VRLALRIHRIYLPLATPGVMELLPNGGELLTLEDPMLGIGAVVGSCVPEGDYRLERHKGAHLHFPDTWALVGEYVSHQPMPGFPRSACVFHGGDTVADTEGCPLVGLSHRFVLGKPVDLDGCALAMARLRAHLGEETELELEIVRG
jgi:hypothetical protein